MAAAAAADVHVIVQMIEDRKDHVAGKKNETDREAVSVKERGKRTEETGMTDVDVWKHPDRFLRLRQDRPVLHLTTVDAIRNTCKQSPAPTGD